MSSGLELNIRYAFFFCSSHMLLFGVDLNDRGAVAVERVHRN